MGHFRVAGRPRWEAGAGWSSWGQQDVEVGLSLTWCSDRRVNLACGFPHTALSWPPWLALPPGGGWLWPSPCSGGARPPWGLSQSRLPTLQAPPGPHRGSCLPFPRVALFSLTSQAPRDSVSAPLAHSCRRRWCQKNVVVVVVVEERTLRFGANRSHPAWCPLGSASAGLLTSPF